MRIVIGNGALPAMAATEREEKGKSILRTVEDYVVLDLETTGLDSRRDEIIEAGALRVRGNDIVARFEQLIRPTREVDEFIIELTGITNEMLADAPGLEDVLPQLLDFIGDDVILGHNVSFDINFLYDAAAAQGLKLPGNDYLDTMRLSRRLYREERHHRLIDLAQRLCGSKDDDTAHRAAGDAGTTKACYDAMIRDMAARELTMDDLKSSPRYRPADGIQATREDFDTTTAVYGRTFVFTGALDAMQRKDAMQLVVDLGGLVGDGVNKETNYLVLGNKGYVVALSEGKSSKQKKAEKMQAKGGDIEIITEDVFYEMIREASGKPD